MNIAFAFFFASCSNELEIGIDLQNKGSRFIISEFNFEQSARTAVEITDKAAVFTWAADDTIGIFPDTDASQARFTMIDGAGTKSAIFDGGGWALKVNSKYASYYPYIPDVNLDKNKIPVDYTGMVQNKSGNTDHLGSYDFMAACANVPIDGDVDFEFKHLGCLLQLKLTLPKASSYNKITFNAAEKIFVEEGYYDLMADHIEIVPETLADTFSIALQDVITQNDNEEIEVYFMMPPSNLSGKEVKLLVSGDNGILAEGDVILKDFVAGTAYSFTATLNNKNAGPTHPDEDLDGVVVVQKSGTLENLLGESKFQLSDLVVKGQLNSDDIALIRRMAGGFRDTTDVDFGILKNLDLSRVTLVAGGSYYLDDGKTKYRIKSSDAIDACMFNGCAELVSLILPNNVVRIEEAAISSCTNLQHVEIPYGVTSFGVAAFNSCKSLESIQMPSMLTSMGSDVFHSCVNLRSIVIPQGVTSIQANSFGHCLNLNEVSLPNGLLSIGSAAFAACDKLERIVIPNTVTEIGQRAFGSCATLAEVTLSSGQSILESYTFENCTALTSIVIPEGVEVIASRAFSGCVNLTRYQLPSTLVELESRAFYTATFKSPIVVECAAAKPPIIGENVWKTGDHVAASKLYVKDASVEDYRSSSWNEFFGEILAK